MGTEDSPENGEDPESEVDKETIHRLCPTYATDINSPLRHVRTRIYFTSESHVHSLINVLRFSHLAGKYWHFFAPAVLTLMLDLCATCLLCVRTGCWCAETSCCCCCCCCRNGVPCALPMLLNICQTASMVGRLLCWTCLCEAMTSALNRSF